MIRTPIVLDFPRQFRTLNRTPAHFHFGFDRASVTLYGHAQSDVAEVPEKGTCLHLSLIVDYGGSQWESATVA